MSTEKRAARPGREEGETVEKAACQLIEIDKPLFRERLHERQSSMSSSQAALRKFFPQRFVFLIKNWRSPGGFTDSGLL